MNSKISPTQIFVLDLRARSIKRMGVSLFYAQQRKTTDKRKESQDNTIFSQERQKGFRISACRQVLHPKFPI